MIARIVDGLVAPFYWIFSKLLWFIATPQKMNGFSLAGRCAVFVTVGLYTVGAAIGVLQQTKYHSGFEFLMSNWLVWGALIPFLAINTYFVVAWMEDPSHEYDYEYQWLGKSWLGCVKKLEKAGYPLASNLPVYLMIGFQSTGAADQFMNATNWEELFRFNDDGPLRCYVYKKHGIFLALCEKLGAVSQFALREATEVIPDANEVFPSLHLKRLRRPTEGINESVDRLAFLCKCLRSERAGLVSHNGVVVHLAMDILDGVHREQVPEVVDRDLTMIREATQVNAVTLMLTGGMEKVDGFEQVTRNLRTNSLFGSRFGKTIHTLPTPANCRALAEACRNAFERAIFRAIARNGPDSNRANRKLYALLCRTRGDMYKTMVSTMGRLSQSSHPFIFSGWYFAETGRKTDQNAFLPEALSKLTRHANDVEWLESAIQSDNRFHWLQRCALLIGFLIFCASAYEWLRIFTRQF